MSSTTTTSETCAHLRNPNPYTVFLASFILVGILVSYLPQHIKIIQRRSSEGLSPWWVLLGGVSSIAAIGNILVLPASRRDIRCCKEVSGGECAAALLGVGQIGLQWGCFMFIVFLFLTFFPAASKPKPSIPSSQGSTPNSHPPKRREALTVGITILTTILLVFIASLTITSTYPKTVSQRWAEILGTIAGTVSMVQYLPQIYFTYRMRALASLSVITMIIQVPGAFLFAFSLWLRVGWEGWSTWLVFVVTGFLQAVLLGLAVVYYVADQRDVREEVQAEIGAQEEQGDVDETTALLGSANGNGKADGRSTLDRLLEGARPEENGDSGGEGRT